jgi:hypothetical protein
MVAKKEKKEWMFPWELQREKVKRKRQREKAMPT